MKVIKVVVDELPDNCGFCPLCAGVKNRQKYITERELFCNVRFEYLTYENMICRPDWCPLDIEHFVNFNYRSPNPAEVEKILKEFKKRNKNISL